ncbi:type II toxin-antitoxin system RelE/ParE family toxin [Desulforamulus aeronauticus]|uniref:type II toxin-antitoxin system RelE/ParE family toxin n=1 Tax=Desulforamulus aeronauticus TaxID=53343 RepID=UPI0009331318|nr:type II toxin-antitoxin system RelE/ParE family toxin [Desulforamulus aeronauticus]
MLSAAYRNLDSIFAFIANEINAELSAINLIDKLEEAILSLEVMPQRGARRRVGAYASRGYRQLFVKNFTIVYRIDERKKEVIIVAVRYSRSEF